MPTPGFEVRDQDVLARAGGIFSTATWMIAGLTTRGPLIPVAIKSMSELAERFGDPTAPTGRDNVNGLLFDSVEAFYQQTPAGQVWVSRDVGPAAAAATLNLSDGTATTLVAKAGREGNLGPGAWGNSLRVAVLDQAGARAIQVSHATLGVLETSPYATAKTTLLAWSASSKWIVLQDAAGTGLPSAISATALASGTDDRASIGDTQSIAAMAKHSTDQGPGILSYPGNTDTDVQAAIQAQAKAQGRLAFLDPTDTTSSSTAAGFAATPRATDTSGLSAMFWPWGNLPALALGGSVRPIPPSAIAAGVVARNAQAGVPSNQAPAGTVYGAVKGIASLRADTRSLTDTQRGTLNDAGVNLIQDTSRFGMRIYGARTLADPTLYPLRKWLPNSRLFQQIEDEAMVVLDQYGFTPNSGQSAFYAQVEQELWQVVSRHFLARELYGATLQDAADVQVASVNNDTTAEAGYLYATIALRPGPPIEREVLNLVRVAPSATINPGA